jgi:hypothetical protein
MSCQPLARYAQLGVLYAYSYMEADELERTFKFTQAELAEHVDESSRRKVCHGEACYVCMYLTSLLGNVFVNRSST